MKKSKFWSLLLTCGAIGLAIGGANFNRKVAPAVFAHHEDHITHEVEGHSKVRPTLTPKELVIPTGGVAISSKADFASHFNNTDQGAGKSLYLTTDIDMEGWTTATDIGMHGTYSKIFEGNGFTVSNFTAGQLFHIIGTTGEVRNANFRYTIRNSSTALCYQHNGTIDNVKIEYTIAAVRDHIGGFSRIGGSGTVKDSQVDFIFEGAGTGSVTNLMAVAYQGTLTATNCSYYENVSGKIQAQGLTKRTDPIEWGGVLPPRASVVAGYVDKIYVEEDPKYTEITAEILNTEETPVWSISDLVGGAFGSVNLVDNVARVTALAKGTVSFKFKATIDATDYLSSLVTIKVLNSKADYDIPENAHEIKDRASFESFFQGSGVNNNKNAYLSQDVDLGGKNFNLGMAGEYSAIFEGQGYKLYNFTMNRLFELTTSTMIIRNLNLEFATNENIVGGAALVYRNSGLIQNVRMKITISQGVKTFAGIGMTGGGVFENCHTDLIVKSTNSEHLYPIAQDDGGKTLVDCSWTMNGAADTVLNMGSNPGKTRDLVRQDALGFQLLVMGYEGGDIVTEECAAKWAAANTKWNAISADSRQQVKTIAEFEDAWLRYQNWALANGSTPDEGTGSGLKTNNNLNLTATIIIGAIGLTTLVGYYFINKKKVHA